MFNAELKERYLGKFQAAPMRTQVERLFERTCKTEELLVKDVAEFSLENIEEFFSTIDFAEPNYVRTTIGDLSSYADWYCAYRNLPGHHIREYKVEMFPYAKHFAPTIIKTPEELCNKLLQVYNIDDGQPAVILLCMAWLGLDVGEALGLRNEQVDPKNGAIYDVKGNVLIRNIPNCIQEILQVYSKTRTATREQNRVFTVYADDLGFFIKRMVTENSGKVGKPISKEQATVLITTLRNQYNGTTGADKTLNYTNVQRSGNFYRLRQMDLAGVDVRSVKNADKVRLCLGKSKRNHKDNMLLYNAYLEIIGEK